MKRKMNYAVAILAFIFAMCFILVGCGGKEFVPTKNEMSTTFSEVSNVLTSQTGRARGLLLSEEDFVKSTDQIEVLRIARLNLLVSEICKNEDFEMTSNAFDFLIEKIDGMTDAKLKMKTVYEDGLTKFEIILDVDGLENATYLEFLNVVVDYDYERKEINSFKLEDFMPFDDMLSLYKYENGQLKMLNRLAESYTFAKEETIGKANSFVASDYQKTDYNFTTEYNTAMAYGA